MDNISKQILDRWATIIAPKNSIFIKEDGSCNVNQKKCLNYNERGYKGDEVLWIPPKDCIRLEFEDTVENNKRYIAEIESAAKSLGFDYCITGHGGKSDYFNMFNIKGIPLDEDNKDAKFLLIDLITTKNAKEQLDRTNLGWTLSPIIGTPHWKPKYNGAIHQILRGKNPLEHNNIYPKNLLKQLKKSKEKNKKILIDVKQTAPWVEDFLLNYCLTHKLPQGQRNSVIEKNLAALIAFNPNKDVFIRQWCNIQGMNSINGWIVAVLKEQITNVTPGELVNYIKHNKIDYTIPIEEFKEVNEKDIIKRGKIIDESNQIIYEQIYKEGVSQFCCYNHKTGEITYVNSVGEIFPINDEEVEKGAILLPTEAIEYGTDDKLDDDIKTYINKWLDIPNDILQFALWNIKRSWVYERFNTLNYLRALGDTGQGKSRFLDTLGNIHYKPLQTSGATTSAPIFRIIDKWKGTLIMDEADLPQSDEANDIIKIINQGYEKNKFILRCDQNDANKINMFDPFCPKILATRKTFTDKATESRCITYVMMGTNRKDIPNNLTKTFFNETLILRNKLLMWRFRNYFIIDPEKQVDFDFGDIEPRMKQIVISFISLFSHQTEQLERFKIFIKEQQEELIEERRTSFAGQIVEGIHKNIENGNLEINAADIITEAQMVNNKGIAFNPRALQKTLKELGFKKTILNRNGTTVKRCLPLEHSHINMLFKRYGINYIFNEKNIVKPQTTLSNNEFGIISEDFK
jgi:hypothetical protein